MMAAVADAAGPARRGPGIGVSLRFARRELRGGLAGFRVFVACIALGVATVAGVSSVARMASDTIAREGQAILGGDVSFNLVQRAASPEELAFIRGLGPVSEAVTLRAMARRADGADQVLVEMKAVDAAYPLYGAVTLAGGGSVAAALAGPGGEPRAVVEESLLARLGLKLGDSIAVGDALLPITDVVTGEPDRLSVGADWGPRLLVDQAALAASNLVQAGSLLRYRYRVALPPGTSDADVLALSNEAKRLFPDAGWQIERRDGAAPTLRRSIDRFAEFLTLLGLAALVVGGVGVANAVRAFLLSRRDSIATLKSLGAPADLVLRVYLAEIMAIACLAILIGLGLGAALPFLALPLLATFLPLDLAASLYPAELAIAAAYGAAVTAAFALVPLGRARQTPATALFRDDFGQRRERVHPAYAAAALVAPVVLAGLAIGFARDREVAIGLVVGTLGAFVLLRLVGTAVMLVARALPRPRNAGLRLALANIHRPGALTPTLVLSLGLGLTLLAALTLVDGNLRRELSTTIPATAPTFFFIDVPASAFAGFAAFVQDKAPGSELEHVPVLRGRITKVGDVPAEEAAIDPDYRWVLSGDRGFTFAEALPKNARLAEGAWWPADYDGPPLVSLAADVAAGLHLALGDHVTVNVLGRPIVAAIANLREVEWESFAISFVMVFSPSTFRGAPYAELATLTLPAGTAIADEVTLQRDLARAFPAVTGVRVKEALQRASDIVGQIVSAILAASGITILTAMLVLAGALAASHQRRVYEAVILRTLGATRVRIVAAFALEYLMLATATALVALGLGSLAAWFILTRFMESHFAFVPGAAIMVVAVAVVLTVTLGLAGTWRALGAKPAAVLRHR